MTDENASINKLSEIINELRERVRTLECSEMSLREAEKTLREGELRFKTLAEAAFEGIALTEQGIIVDCNDQLATMLAYTRDELIGKSVLEFVAPESQKRVSDAHHSGKEELYEHIAMRKDGTRFPVEVHGRFLRSANRELRLAAIRDLTSHVDAEEALKRERNLLRTLIDNLPDLIYFKDVNGRYVLNNRAHLHSLGITAQEEVLGKSSFEYNPLELATQYREDEMAIMRTKEPLLAKEELALHNDTGKHRWHLTSKIPLVDAQSVVVGIVGISRDITDRKRLEEQRDRYVLELQDALDKVKTLSGLLPICSSCKKIRDDKGYWKQVEGYIMEHSSARFTHGLCPECLARAYPDFATGPKDH